MGSSGAASPALVAFSPSLEPSSAFGVGEALLLSGESAAAVLGSSSSLLSSHGLDHDRSAGFVSPACSPLDESGFARLVLHAALPAHHSIPTSAL